MAGFLTMHLFTVIGTSYKRNWNTQFYVQGVVITQNYMDKVLVLLHLQAHSKHTNAPTQSCEKTCDTLVTQQQTTSAVLTMCVKGIII